MTASWVIIRFAQHAQVGGQGIRRVQGAGVVFAQDPAAPVQGVLVQLARGLHLAQLAQVGGQGIRRAQGPGVVFAQDPAAPVQGVLVQVAGGLDRKSVV